MKKTIKNLMTAFIGESQARNRYTFYAKQARKEGYEQIAEIFEKTAENEREHAKWLMRMINNLKEKTPEIINEINVEAGGPTILGQTIDNLKSAIAGEDYETINMYPEFAKIADEENLPEIADRLRAIAIAEAHHKDRFSKLLSELKNNTLYKKDKKVYWICRKCGYVYEGEEPPEECPSCSHSKNYFELKCEQY